MLLKQTAEEFDEAYEINDFNGMAVHVNENFDKVHNVLELYENTLFSDHEEDLSSEEDAYSDEDLIES